MREEELGDLSSREETKGIHARVLRRKWRTLESRFFFIININEKIGCAALFNHRA